MNPNLQKTNPCLRGKEQYYFFVKEPLWVSYVDVFALVEILLFSTTHLGNHKSSFGLIKKNVQVQIIFVLVMIRKHIPYEKIFDSLLLICLSFFSKQICIFCARLGKNSQLFFEKAVVTLSHLSSISGQQ